jgi:hypothetical protein
LSKSELAEKLLDEPEETNQEEDQAASATTSTTTKEEEATSTTTSISPPLDRSIVADDNNTTSKWHPPECPLWLISFLQQAISSLTITIKAWEASEPELPPAPPTQPQNVRFSISDDIIEYDITPEDVKNSWLTLDIPRTLHNIEMISLHRGIAVSYSEAAHIPGKTCMVHIEPSPLINEITEMCRRHRDSVLAEQREQRRDGGRVDAEKLASVAAKYSRWGVNLALSNWWLDR